MKRARDVGQIVVLGVFAAWNVAAGRVWFALVFAAMFGAMVALTAVEWDQEAGDE